MGHQCVNLCLSSRRKGIVERRGESHYKNQPLGGTSSTSKWKASTWSTANFSVEKLGTLILTLDVVAGGALGCGRQPEGGGGGD